MTDISAMEARLNAQTKLLEEAQLFLKIFKEQEGEFKSLQDYYYSDQYLVDMDAANRGEFDKIPCGVLSEDAIYNLITDRQALAIQLLEVATQILKG